MDAQSTACLGHVYSAWRRAILHWCTPICAASVYALTAPPSPYKILRKGGRKVEVAPTASICRGGPSVNRLLGPRAPSPPSPYRRPPPVWAVESQPPARRWPPLALSHRQPLRNRAPLSSYALARERQSVPTVTLSAGVLSFRSPGGPCAIIITATICCAAALWLREHLHCGPRGCAARTRTDARAPFLFSSLICLARARTLRRPRVLSWARRRAAHIRCAAHSCCAAHAHKYAAFAHRSFISLHRQSFSSRHKTNHDFATAWSAGSLLNSHAVTRL